MRAYYNEHDPFAAAWLRNLITAGKIPAGDVDDRDIQQVDPNELIAYTQVHLFAGIGGWPLALRWAGWPTPNAIPPGRGGLQRNPEKALERRSQGHQLNLDDAATLVVGWPTPVKGDANGCDSEAHVQKLKAAGHGYKSLGNMRHLVGGWPTPTASKTTPQSRDNQCLARDAILYCGSDQQFEALKHWTPKGWATPSSRDWKDTPGMAETGINPDGSERARLDQLPRQVTGLIMNSSPAGTKPIGVLNPDFSRWLMGFPDGWGCFADTATRSSRRSPRNGSKPTSK